MWKSFFSMPAGPASPGGSLRTTSLPPDREANVEEELASKGFVSMEDKEESWGVP